MRSPKGTLTEDGEHATLTFRRVYPHAPLHVWNAIATAEGLREWLLCSHAVIEPCAGGRIELVSGPSAYHSVGKILVWEPPRVLEYEWNVAPVPEMPKGERAIFRYELSAEGDGTRVLVTYRRITRHTASGFLPGLHAFLDRLEAQLASRTPPDWLQRFAELRVEYPEWSRHAPDTAI
jgi:uncharacterized protein YndB with AHSA1/START domain